MVEGEGRERKNYQITSKARTINVIYALHIMQNTMTMYEPNLARMVAEQGLEIIL